jgi:hypothetical protein
MLSGQMVAVMAAIRPRRDRQPGTDARVGRVPPPLRTVPGLRPSRSTAGPGSWRRGGNGATMRLDAKGSS